MELKELNIGEALQVMREGDVFMMVPVSRDTTLGQLDGSVGFCCWEDEDPDDIPEDDPEETDGDLIHDFIQMAEKKPEELMERAMIKQSKKANGVEWKPRSSKLDYGKIFALHRAGWPTQKIADEMQCTGQTVRNVVKKMSDNFEKKLKENEPADVAASTDSVAE